MASHSVVDRSVPARPGAFTRRRALGASAMVGLSALAGVQPASPAHARLQGDPLGPPYLDPLNTPLATLPAANDLGFGINGGVRIVFDPDILVEGNHISADQRAALPDSFQAALTVQCLATVPGEPRTLTGNTIFRLYVFTDDDGARSWVRTLDAPWLTGSATIYSDEQAVVSGHQLVSYETADQYQPALTNTVWNGTIRHGAFVWQQTHGSTLDAFAGDAGLATMVELARMAKNAMRETTDLPLLTSFILPNGARELQIVPGAIAGQVPAFYDVTAEEIERRERFAGGAETLLSNQFIAALNDGRDIFANQNVFGFPDEGGARQFFDGFPEHMAPLDEASGTSRVFSVPKDGPLVEVEIRDPYIVDAFVFPSGDARFGGVELTWLRNDRVMTLAFVSLEPVGDQTVEKFAESTLAEIGNRLLAEMKARDEALMRTNPGLYYYGPGAPELEYVR